MPAKSKDEAAELVIVPVVDGVASFCVIGVTPLIFNAMSAKAKRTLLLGGSRKTAADKAANLKHDPLDEYRDSVYRNFGDDRPTRLAFPKESFKGAMMTAALDMPGTRKAEIGRLVQISGTHIDIYGVPRLMMSVVRSADIARTPDIRTRAICPAWACRVTVRYVQPKLNLKAVGNLLAAAGMLCGVGDFRQEKGKGDYGLFRLCAEADLDFQSIVNNGGGAAQDAALETVQCYDAASAELLDWYEREILRLGRKAQTKPEYLEEGTDGAFDNPAPGKAARHARKSRA